MALREGHTPLPRDHPLAGCEAKLLRAHETLESIDRELASYLQRPRDPIARIGKLDPHTQRHIRWNVGPVDEPDLTIAAAIGEFIHDLRSALDHIAFELSFRDTNGTIPNRKIAFPVCRTRAEWNRDAYKMNGINKTHRAMIYRAQPCYRRKDAPSAAAIARRPRNGLADLDDFWNDDKHRTLQPVASALSAIQGEITAIRDCVPIGRIHLEKRIFGRALKEGANLFWVPVRPTGPKPEMEMDLQVALNITFRNGLPVTHTLVGLGNWVRNVVEAFIPQLEDRKARRLWGAPRGGWIEDVPVQFRTAMRAGGPGDPIPPVPGLHLAP